MMMRLFKKQITKGKDFVRLAVGLLFLLVSLLFVSCPQEIGLGSAVDTQKPVITITTPEADSHERGTISLAGSVSDDLSIKSVTVTFTSTSNPSLPSKTYNAQVNSTNKTWSLSVDSTNSTSGLSDSNYEIIATATDNSNKSSSASRSIQVDNTKPTVLITSPSLYGSDENRALFCNQVEIKGEAYDASTILSILVYICDANGDVVAGPVTADGTNTWSALFTSESLSGLQNNGIYYYYPVATDASNNVSTIFYHKSDIYSLLTGGAAFPSMNDIGHLDQGTSPSSSCTLTLSDIEQKKLGITSASIRAGALSATGYPDFSFKTQADATVLWTNLEGDSPIIGVGSAVFATIQPPSDNSSILPNTVHVWIKSKNQQGEWKDLVEQSSFTKQKVGESLNISIDPKNSDNQSLQVGDHYVKIECKTNSNATIVSDKEFKINSGAPIITESSIYTGNNPTASFAQGIISGNVENPQLSGYILLSDQSVAPSLDGFTVTFTEASEPDFSEEFTIGSTASDIHYNATDGSWYLPVPATNLQGGSGWAWANGTYTVTIEGTVSDVSTTLTRVIIIDTNQPNLTISSPASDSTYKAETESGFRIQGIADDEGSGIVNTYWCIDVDSASHSMNDSGIDTATELYSYSVPEIGKWYKFSMPTSFNLKPDLAGFAEKKYKLYLFTRDAAGYTSEDMTEIPFFVDNDVPVLSVTEWPSLSRHDAEHMTICGKAYDSSGSLDKVMVSFDGGTPVVIADLSSGSYTSGSQADWTFSSDSDAVSAFDWTEGTHTLSFTVTDEAGRTSTTNADVKKTFTIDATPPVVTIANLSDGATFSTMDTPISGTVTDTISGIDKVQYSTDGGTSWHDATVESGAWSINLGTLDTEDNQSIRIKALDIVGNTSYLPVNGEDIHFFIDKANPKGTIEVTTDNPVLTGDTVMTNKSFTLSGVANDTAGGTAIREASSVKLAYSKDGASAVTVFSTEEPNQYWKKGTENGITGAWTWTMPESFEEGFYIFTLTVTDSAHKVTTVTKSVRYDKTAPVLTVTTPANNEFFNSSGITMRGSVSDSGCGVNKVYYKLDAATDWSVIDPVGYSWNENVHFGTEGTHTLTIKAEDMLGNASDPQTSSFSYDLFEPSLTVAGSAGGIKTNTAFTLSGTASDTNALKGNGTGAISITAAKADGTQVLAITENVASGNWSHEFTPGSGNGQFADETYTFTVTVTDAANRTKSQSRTITVDTTAPSVGTPSFTASGSIPADKANMVYLDESKFKKFSVTASDSGTELAGVYYQLLNSATAPSIDDSGWISLAQDNGDSWTANIDFTGKEEGTYYVFVAAKDTAGNSKVNQEGAAVIVDERQPVVTVSGDTAAGARNVELTITVDDTNPGTPTVEIKKDAVSKGNLSVRIGQTNQWKVTVPFGATGYEDGVYSVVVNEKDTNGRSAVEKTHTIRRDTAAPSISITAPEVGKTGENALYGTSYLFKGNIDDGTGTGPAKVYYAFKQTQGKPTDLNAYTELTVTSNGEWSIPKSLNTGTTPDSGNLCEGKWYLYVLAEDTAGNCTVLTEALERVFDIDMNAPVLTVTNFSNQTVYTDADNYVISGSVTETNGIASVKAIMDETSSEAGTSLTNTGTDEAWSFKVERKDENKDQLHTVTVTVIDAVGKSAEKTVSFYFDTQAPSVTITEPAENVSLTDNTYTLEGTVVDAGSGVDKTQTHFSITKGGNEISQGELTVTGTTWKAQNVSLGDTDAEGTLTLVVTFKDKVGKTARLTRTFYKDVNNPELRVLSIGAEGKTTNENFMLAGTAWDTNELKSITISDGTTTWTSEGTNPAITLTPKTENPGDEEEDWNWSINFAVGSAASGNVIADGSRTFTITAADVAGKTVSATRTVNVDTTSPAIEGATAEGTASIPANKVFTDESVYKRINVTASDPAVNGNSGTGLAGIYCRLLTEGTPAPTELTSDGWTALALGSEGWNANVDFSGKNEGNYKIYIAAKDNAGNSIISDDPIAITVDAKKPVLSVSGATAAGASDVILTITVDDTNPGTPTVEIKKDAVSKGNLSVSRIGQTNKWTVTVPFSNDGYNDGVYTVFVNETDANGRKAVEKTHTIRRDTTPPAKNTIDSPETGKTGTSALNGSSYIFRGTAFDIEYNAESSDRPECAGLAKIYYAFTTSSTAPVNLSDYTAYETSDGSWEIPMSLTTVKPEDASSNPILNKNSQLYEGKWYLYVKAEDNAGNCTTDTVCREFDIDMNDPILTVTSPGESVQTNYLSENSITLNGRIIETNGVSSVKVKVGDENAYDATVTKDGTSYSWSSNVNRSDSNKDTLLSTVIAVTDKAGKTTEKTVSLYFDTVGPAITITSPAADEVKNTQSCTITGTVADIGSGNSTNGRYIIKKDGEEVTSGSLSINGTSWTAENVNLGEAQGNLELTISIEDKVGNDSSMTNSFFYDKDLPEITETEIGTSKTLGKVFTLKGTASDTYKLKEDGTGAISITAAKADGTQVLAIEENVASGIWSHKFTPGSGNGELGDGTYTFTITVKDAANRTTSLTRTVIIDTKKPTIKKENTFITSTVSNVNQHKLYKDEYLGLKAIVSDNEGGGGLEKVEYAVISQSAAPVDSDWTNAFWTTMTLKDSAYAADAKVESGTNYIRIRATDKAGNVEYSTAETAQVDLNTPETADTEFSLDGQSVVPNLLTNTTFGGTLYKEFTIKQKARDENGIQKIQFKINNGAFIDGTLSSASTDDNPWCEYTYTVKVNDADSVMETNQNCTLEIKVIDNANRENTRIFTFKVDNTAPTITVTSHEDNDRVKGTFFIAGTTQDAPLYGPAATMLYKVTASSETPSDWDTQTQRTYKAHPIQGNLGSWRLYFDDDIGSSDGYAHDQALKRVLVTIPDYANTLEIATRGENVGAVVWKTTGSGHTAGDLFTPITTLYIHFKAEDRYGNTTYFKRALSLDPQGDIPTVTMAYPEIAGYGWWMHEGDETSPNKIIYTTVMSPEKNSSAFESLADLTKKTSPVKITGVNIAEKTITADGKTYTFFGGITELGGTIRIQGTAEDEKAVSKVFLQIDPTYNPKDGFEWNEGSAGSARLPGGTPLNDFETYAYTVEEIDADRTGIRAKGTTTWNFSLNSNGEFNGQNGATNLVAVRAIAVDEDGHTSPFTDVIVMSIDSDTPRIGNSEELYLYQYKDNATGSGDVVASVKYEDDMWLQGEWWLKGSVEDAGSISSITVTDMQTNTNTDAISNRWATSCEWNSESVSRTKGYILQFKIGSSEKEKFGSLSYKIVSRDNEDKEVEKTISINFDNKSPTLSEQGSAQYKINAEVKQSNGFYTLESAVTEEASVDGTQRQSGFDRLAIYFVNPGDTKGTGTLYDTYQLKQQEGNALKIKVDDKGAAKNGSDVFYRDGLYWKTKTITADAETENRFTLSEDVNIHAGGLVMIGGTLYTIKTKTVNGTVATIEINGEPPAATKADFAMAMIVDHTLTESNGSELGDNGYYTNVMNDDGDCMVESVTTQGTVTYWSANINSHNIPDGPIEIHYVAFDKAGNYSIGIVACEAPENYKGLEDTATLTYEWDENNKCRVANNAPRLAGVKYGTDYNGDGSVSDDEMDKDFFAISETGTYKSNIVTSYILGTKSVDQNTRAVTLSNPYLSIKGGIKVVPEIIGGNGALKYSWSITENGTAETYYETNETTAFGVSGKDYTGSGDATEIVDDAVIDLDMMTLLKAISENDDMQQMDKRQLFTFKIWDSTPGLTAGVNSMYATLELVADFDITDTEAPKTYIKPFYWLSKSNNSVYKDDLGNLKGHIDLGSETTISDTSIPASIRDADDKVSGAIIIEGSASDNVLIDEIWMKLYTGKNKDVNDVFTFPRTDTATKNAVQLATGGLSYYKVAKRESNGSWTTYGNYDSNGWKFEVLSGETFDREGHKAYWKLTLNTEKITGVAAADVQLAVMARDKGSPSLNGNTITYANAKVSTLASNKSSGETTDTQTNYTRFDVVPYITGVNTFLSDLKKSNPSIANRTALGHYPVKENETVIVAGYNLKGAKYGNTTLSDAATVADYYKKTASSFVQLSVNNVTKSGSIMLTNNSIPTLNNVNANDAKGAAPVDLSQENYSLYAYNRQPNGDSNNLLTDDVIFDIWQFNSQAVKSNSGKIDNPVMKIDPNNGKLGFAFADGFNFYMPNKNGSTQYSYIFSQLSYDLYSTVDMVFDSDGNAYAVGTGGDSNAHQADMMNFMSSRWGTGTTDKKDGSSNGTNALRLESIGMLIQTGTTRKSANKGQSGGDKIVIEMERIQSPSLATFGTSGVYLAYYDLINDEIRFRGGKITGNKNVKARIGTLTDDYTSCEMGTNTTYNEKDHGPFYWNDTKTQIVTTATGKNATGYNQKAEKTYGENNVLGQSGNYVSIATTFKWNNNNKDQNSPVVVMVWYDSHNKQLCYNYNTKPDEETTGSNATNWATTQTLMTGGGEYCQVVTDPDGGIHIAAYDKKNKDLKYFYLSRYDSNNVYKCTVDSYDVVGQNITLDVAKDANDKNIPYIGYYSMAQGLPKYAYLVNAGQNATNDFNGTDSSDLFTGVWECTYLPTESSVPQSKISLGVYKDKTTGKRKASTKNTNNIQNNQGLCYANGTDNPVLGYKVENSVTEDNIETAQMK